MSEKTLEKLFLPLFLLGPVVLILEISPLFGLPANITRWMGLASALITLIAGIGGVVLICTECNRLKREGRWNEPNLPHPGLGELFVMIFSDDEKAKDKIRERWSK